MHSVNPTLNTRGHSLPARSGMSASPDVVKVITQVDAGAEVILTQPPLLKGQFEAWYEGLSRQECSNLHPTMLETVLEILLQCCSTRHSSALPVTSTLQPTTCLSSVPEALNGSGRCLDHFLV